MAFGFPKVTQASAVKPQYAGNEKLMLLGALLRDLSTGQGPEMLLGTQKYLADNARQRQRLAAEQGLVGALGFGPQPYRGIGPGADGEPLDAKPAPKVPTIREALPALIAAQRQGVDVGDYLTMLDKAGPDLTFVNGMGVDQRDPGNIGKRVGVNLSNVNGVLVDQQDPTNAGRFIPQFDKGQEPLYDSRGQIVAIRNIDGSVQSAAEMAGAVEGAKARATAPYEFVNVPTPSGAPGVTSKANAAGRTFIGQSPAEAARAEAMARGDADRANALEQRATQAASQLATLDNMERLLPDVISGFGAETRLNAARALAFAGNEGAAKQVTATETYLNEARNLVSDIIKSFGANPTEGERKYAERMSGADANLNPETLREGIRLRRERINRDLANAGRPAPAPQTKARPAPKSGEVVNGYRFRGGDPRNPQSWQKVN